MWTWLGEHPLPVFQRGLDLLDPLAARQALTQTAVTRLAMGRMRDTDASNLISDWEEAAGRLYQDGDDDDMPTLEELAREFTAAGLNVQVV